MEIIDNRALLLRVRNPKQIEEVIPKSRRINEHEILVNWGLDEAIVLDNMGIKNVPSPILGQYKWPSPKKPFDHQRHTAGFLTMNRRAFCFSEQGCVDSETEYLSPTGWVKISEYTGGKVAQYWPGSGTTEFVDPIGYIRKECAKMIRFKSSNTDQLLSSEHRVLLYRDGHGHYVESAAVFAIRFLSGEFVHEELISGGEGNSFPMLPDDGTSSVTLEPSTDGFKYCFEVPSTYLMFRRNGKVFASGNTGKTASVIWAADYLLNIGKVNRVLVVCPMSIMRSAWANDLFTFAIHRTFAIAHSHNKAGRVKAINSDAEFVIINYDGIRTVREELKAGGFDLIVADEATALKTTTTDRWKMFNNVAGKDSHLWLLTGTPAAQTPTDAYGLAKLVNPSGVPNYFSAFRDQVMVKVTNFKWIPRIGAKDLVHRALQPAIRYTKEECLDLPDITYVDREAPMTKQQEKYYQTVLKHMQAEVAGSVISSVNAATQINKLVQIATGSAYDEDGGVVEFDLRGRLDVMMEVINETDNKVVVFVPFTHTIHRVSDYLTSKKINNAIINGAVSMDKRSSLFDKFQNKGSDLKALVIQPQAAAHGVTLTAADTIIWFAPTTSVEIYLQGNARIHRAGQGNPCTVVNLHGSGVEKKMYTMLQGNINTHQSIVDTYKNVLDTGGN